MENKKSFLAYADWKGMFDALPDEIAGKLVKHLFAYVNDLNPKSDDFVITALFEPIKATLKRDLIKWEVKSNEKSHNGRMGNLKRYNLDIYEQVKSGKITLEQGEELAKSRKDSHGDNSPSLPLAKLAVSDSVSVSVSDKKENINIPPAASKPFTQFSKDDFHLEVKPFVDKYGKQTCRDFFNYWTEPNARGKMRFQLEKTWSVSNRLSTWKKNEGKFGNTEAPKQQTKIIPGPWNV